MNIVVHIMKHEDLKPGRRYRWRAYLIDAGDKTIPSGQYHNGLFTGTFHENGCAVLIENGNLTWMIPPENLEEVRKGR